MIKRIHLWNFGPFTDQEFIFDPASPNILAGRSESGKNSIMEAVSYCLFGKWSNGDAFPASYIRTGAKALAIEMEFANGTILRRTLSVSGTKKRVIIRGENETPYDNEAEFYAAVPTPVLDTDSPEKRAAKEGFAASWKNQDLVRFFMFPQVYQWPKWFSANGREVRDILLSAVPGMNIATVIVEEMKKAGYDQDPKAILSEEHQAKVVTTANKAVSIAEGAKTAAETSKSDAEKALKDAETSFNEAAFVKSHTEASKVLALETEWKLHVVAHDEWTRQNEAISRAEKNLVDWQARKLSVGVEPSKDSKVALDKARGDLAAAKVAISESGKEWNRINRLLAGNQAELIKSEAAQFPGDKDLEAALTLAKAEHARLLSEYNALPDDGPCSTCGSKEYTGAKEKKALALEAGKTARANLDAATKALDDAKAAWEKTREEHVATCKKTIRTQEADLLAAKASYDDTKKTSDELEASALSLATSAQERITWEAAVLALGKEPPAVDKKTDEPKAPAVKRPTTDELEAAKATVALQRPNLDALRATVATASQRLQDASKALEDAEAKAKRAKALLDAVRAAPSIVAAKATAFENIGDAVKIVFEKDSTILLVKDKTGWMPYDKGPSTGRRIRADVILRMWLKTKSRLPLPVFIDSTESCKVKDEPIPVKGFVISMVNEDCDIRVGK